jgi:hypothetical protein
VFEALIDGDGTWEWGTWPSASPASRTSRPEPLVLGAEIDMPAPWQRFHLVGGHDWG